MSEDLSNNKNKPASKLRELNDSLYSRTRYQDPNLNRSAIEQTDEPKIGEEWKTRGIDEIIKSDNRKYK